HSIFRSKLRRTVVNFPLLTSPEGLTTTSIFPLGIATETGPLVEGPRAVAEETCRRIRLMKPGGMDPCPISWPIPVIFAISRVVGAWDIWSQPPVRFSSPDLWTETESIVRLSEDTKQLPRHPLGLEANSRFGLAICTVTVPWKGRTVAGLV